MEGAHDFHAVLGCHGEPCLGKGEFQQAQIGQCDNAAQEMTADRLVDPVADGRYADQVIVLGLTKALLHSISIQGCSYDVVRTPVSAVGNQDVFAELFDLSAYTVMIFPECQGQLAVLPLKAQIVEVAGYMQVLADFCIALKHGLFLFPASVAIPDLGTNFIQGGLELPQLAVKQEFPKIAGFMRITICNSG